MSLIGVRNAERARAYGLSYVIQIAANVLVFGGQSLTNNQKQQQRSQQRRPARAHDTTGLGEWSAATRGTVVIVICRDPAVTSRAPRQPPTSSYHDSGYCLSREVGDYYSGAPEHRHTSSCVYFYTVNVHNINIIIIKNKK